MKVLRKLEGIIYWVIEDPLEIAELVNNCTRKEWESDIAEQKDHEEGRWLASLDKRRWQLVVTELKGIRLSDGVMNYVNEKTGYNFRASLEQRKRMLERDIDMHGAVIRPIVVRAEDRQLMDGYCRYQVLSDREVKETYAYVGTL